MRSFDEMTREGTLLLDDGSRLSFRSEVFAVSTLRHLRPGQRVRVRLDAHGEVAALSLVTMPLGRQ